MSTNSFNSHATRRMLELEGMQLARFRQRALAFALDFLLVAVVFTLVVMILAPQAQKLGWLHEDLKLTLNFTNWYSILSLVVYFGLATFLGNGQTPGKRLLRIRVVSTVHPKLSLWHSVERALGYGASALEFGFGFIQYFFSDNRQTVHDRIAETVVVALPKRTMGKSRGEAGQSRNRPSEGT